MNAIYAALFVVATACAGAQAQPVPVVSTPVSEDFGAARRGEVSGPSIIALSTLQNSHQARIERISWEFGNNSGAFTFNGLSVGQSFSLSRPLQFRAEFRPPDNGSFNDSLIIDARIVEGIPGSPIFSLKIPLRGRGLCVFSGQDCEPSGPECTVSHNSDSLLMLRIPQYSSTILPAIDIQKRRHYSAASSYTLPISFMWEIAGLAPLMPRPSACYSGVPATCLTQECLTGCLSDIQFHRDPRSTSLSNFVWQNDSEFKITSNPNPVAEVEIRLPTQISGQSVVGASFSEMHFSNEQQSPELSIRTSAGLVFEGTILCYSTTLQEAAIRQRRTTNTVPNLNMLVRE